MTKYEEISAAAQQSRTDFFAYRDRSWRNLFALVRGFIDYCGIPDGQISYRRWNGLHGSERAYTRPEDGGQWTLPGAAEFDDDDNYWHLGVHVTLTKPGHIPPNWFSFVLCISEVKGQLMVKIGLPGKPQAIDVTSESELANFFNFVSNEALKLIKEPHRSKVEKKIGFEVTPIEPSGGEKVNDQSSATPSAPA